MVGENLSIKYPSQQCLTEIRKHQSENFYLTSKRRIQWAKQSKSLAAEKTRLSAFFSIETGDKLILLDLLLLLNLTQFFCHYFYLKDDFVLSA
ncbi:MAG: hypothetical protein EAZ39_23640 [Oscillatoriales cyanobacterium]|nr:MAG: hypothetical protein EAZ45_19320 [Oscillatoriales cyanobacterium]TAG14736.1 MAG: hypothetical protein EAZ39_23640 [Oscillatoriales cyanobacterium]TAG33667.1 MAG: hypothetical protein EAZ33_29575 [Oscillatoriales cyanobacterium]TAG62874.1 MAG: hypothetical protein EAZ25_26190 [Oscillatoriales cyanobacterium]